MSSQEAIGTAKPAGFVPTVHSENTELQSLLRIVRDEAEQARASAQATSAEALVARMEARELSARSKDVRNRSSVTRATSRMLLSRPSRQDEAEREGR